MHMHTGILVWKTHAEEACFLPGGDASSLHEEVQQNCVLLYKKIRIRHPFVAT